MCPVETTPGVDRNRIRVRKESAERVRKRESQEARESEARESGHPFSSLPRQEMKGDEMNVSIYRAGVSIRRAQFQSTIAKTESTTIAMEACSSANYWGRTFEAMGHAVLLVPARYVIPFLRGGKSDARDALENGSNELFPVARYSLADQHGCLVDTR